MLAATRSAPAAWRFRPAPRRKDTALTWFQSWLVLHGGSRLASVKANANFQPHVGRVVRDTIGVAARRSGKTAGALGLTILGGLDDGPGDVGYMAPTLAHAKRLLWRPLAMLLREPAAKRFINGKPNNSELTVEFATGTRLYIYSAEAYERVRGDGFKLFIADEADDPIFTDEVFSDAIRPALSDNLGSLVQLGTPKGRARLFREWRKGQGIPCDKCKRVPCEHYDPSYASIQVTAIDAGLLDPQEVRRAKRTLPDRSFRQEYMAEFNAPIGMVYEEWNEERHVVGIDQIPPLDSFDEFIVGVDWGVAKRGAMLVSGIDRKWLEGDDTYEGCDMPRIWALEEHSSAGIPYTDAGWWKIARQIQQQWRPRYWYCDPAGGTEAESDAKAAGLLRQLQQALATVDNRVQVIAGDNRVGPGIAAVQGFLHYDDILKEPPRLFVARTCPWLIKEFGTYRYPANRKFEGQDGEEFDDKPVKESDHVLDSLRYLCLTHFFRRRRAQGRNETGFEDRGG